MRWIALLGLSFAVGAAAAPDLTRRQDLGPVRAWPDHEVSTRWYIAPGPLEIAREPSGAPGLRFLQMRYTGSAATGDQGRTGSFSTLTLRLRMKERDASQLGRIRKVLSRALGKPIELRPVPITAFEARLIYAPIDRPADRQAIQSQGHFEADDGKQARSGKDAFWSERVLTLALGVHDSQLLWQTLQEGRVLMSVGYAFFTRGIGETADVDVDSWGTDPELSLEIGRAMQGALEALGTGDGEGPIATRMISADALAVEIDAVRWPDHFQRVDFEEAAPPGYATLRVYCYDFKDELRPDLFFKKVEVEATAVDGRSTPVQVKFLPGQRDLYARTLRFPVAVRMDRPYRYRVVTASRDGSRSEGPWQDGPTWGRILDVTTPPDQQPERGQGAEG